MAKYIIYSPSYNENSGGVVVLHKLCHILNELGHSAYLFPYAHTYEINRFNISENAVSFLKRLVYSTLSTFKTNEHFCTPIYRGSIKDINNYIVVYPEVVFGNPLKAKNVVRWLLHQPGFHDGRFYYGFGELIFKFNSAIKDFDFPGSTTSKIELKVIHYPLEYYNTSNVQLNRSGYAYCIRKGRGKVYVKDHSNDTLIDNLSHKQISDIFKRVEFFISYDTYTAYSIFAALCGCKSIVVGDSGVSKYEWYPNESDRYGIAYGFNDLEWAETTTSLLEQHILSEEKKVFDSVLSFVNQSLAFFKVN